MTATNEDLAKRDYVIIVDKSGSMSTPDVGGKSRWDAAKESTYALANKCAQFDADGIDLYLFSGSFKKYANTTPEKVEQLFTENDPMGSTALHLPLKDALDNYLANKAKPVTILVVTDGEPDDQGAVAKVIVEATKKLDADEEVAISFLQVGKDEGAKSFLKKLDDDLQGQGAKFDIVDTVTFDEMENLSLSEVLLNAIND
jgi:uncharacterized protein with von Willebrand factor type A (vWA) domain